MEAGTAPASTTDTDREVDNGTALGFTTLENEVLLDSVPVSGEIPGWLEGSLLRTGPAKFEAGTHSYRHWFDGQAMLHRFGIASGNVSYASRFLQTKAHAAAADGRIAYPEFATDPCRGLFKRVMAIFDPGLSDNANVNLTRLGERYIAMTETPIPVQFDAETLDTVGVAYDVPGMLTTAHPHLERSTGGMLNYAAKLGPRNEYRFFHLAADGGAPEVVASAPVDKPAYMHSFGLSERWLILAEFPFVVDPKKLLLSGRPYIENYEWRPERGTRITLFDRAGGGRRVGPFTTDPLFSFHHLNAFEEPDGAVVIDLQAYGDASLIDDLYLDRLRSPTGPDVAVPTVERLRVRPGDAASGVAERETLFDPGFELGRINYGRCNERPYRYAWGIAVRDGWLADIVRADIETRDLSTWSEPGCYPGEPVFVSRPGAESEDDGVLLSVVLDATAETSFLLVLDARDLSELARAQAPHHIPFSFHGQFDRA